MSRKIVVQSIIFIITVAASGKIIASWSNEEHHHHRKIPLDTPFAKEVHLSINKSNQQPRHSLSIAKAEDHPLAINSSLLLPWSSDEVISPSQLISHSNVKTSAVATMANGTSSLYQAQTQNFTTGIKINGQQSAFICPANMPYAVGYSLKYNNSQNNTYPNESPTIYARGYTNSCGPSKHIYDLLYDSDQHSDSNGKAKNLTAFVPSYTPEACQDTSSVSVKQPVIFKIGAQTTESPILEVIGNQVRQVGYQQTTTVNPPDCNQICNTMLDYYCNADSSMSYCGEIVIAAYYVNSVYNARKIHEHFCSCSIKNLTWPTDYAVFTNAVDVESAVSYNNQLASVTCSNIPAP